MSPRRIMKPRALLSWSSGKDSAWTLHVLRQRGDVELVALVTTYTEVFGRVAMHGVREELVRAQADAAGLPLWTVPLPYPCSNAEYESQMRAVIERARAAEVTAFAFGDLFLADIRAYRERQLAGTGIEPLFPLWGTTDDTPALARAMLAAGLQAVLACVDSSRLPSTFAGREFDTRLLSELPGSVDPCGERGEFHTFCYAGPMFQRPIPVSVGDVVERDGFYFADLRPRSWLDSVEVPKPLS
ncbi:MAG: adenine nucleotide alpha hydrolase [Gemmataceae bacterium]|nr:adenine nucleotide alpha hydrolase [Gemmataceae bacterium]